jgi:2-amino-4-hydroxy-6-hydroxymethyldihydropteridine diphosphokinase
MNQGIFLGLGSNLGDRLLALTQAIYLLSDRGIEIGRVSTVYETPPWGNIDQPAFLNLVVEVAFEGSPEDLLTLMLETENLLGRQRAVHWGPRIIDIDLLAFGREILVGQRLSVPHPMLSKRAFVLVPWNEIAPDFVVPGTDNTVAELLQQLPAADRNAIHPVAQLNH